jgi:hypothetical protein
MTEYAPSEKEDRWIKEKIGFFSASKNKCIMAGYPNGFSKVAQSYMYHIQYQRNTNCPDPPVFARAMDIGVKGEPEAIMWYRENFPNYILHCDTNFTDKLFIKTNYGYGASPDAFVIKSKLCDNNEDWRYLEIPFDNDIQKEIISLIEIKCVVGEILYWMFSSTVSFAKKRLYAFSLHRDQLAGQLLVFPNIKTINLLVYNPQLDSNPLDFDSVTDKRRGLVFEYSRAEIGSYLELLEDRIIFCDNFLNRGYDIDLINDSYKIKK